MDINPVLVGVNQSNLLGHPAAQYFALDLQADFWKAAQDLIHPELEVRWTGFEYLFHSGAASHSPLLAYLLVSRLAEPDLELRSQIVAELNKILALPFNGNPSINEVLYFLKTSLSQLRHNQIEALLKLVEEKPGTYPHVSRIISLCSYAGEHLIEFVGDRKASLEIRKTSARLIGDIGYLSSILAMERIKTRLETRINGSGSYTFLGNREADLLPTIEEALTKLRS